MEGEMMDPLGKSNGAALYVNYKIFSEHLLMAVRSDDLSKLKDLLADASSQQMLLMREAPSLFGGNLRQHYTFDGFSFFEPNSLTLLVQLLDAAVNTGAQQSFDCLWATSARLQRNGQVQFLAHFFTSPQIEGVAKNPDGTAHSILLTALVSLSPNQQNELRAHQKLKHHDVFERLMNQAQKERLLRHVPSDQVSAARKL